MADYSTLYFDLTNSDDLAKIESTSINDILLSQDSGDTTGSASPFYIIFKMNGLFKKRKPKSFQVLNTFQETPYPLKFIKAPMLLKVVPSASSSSMTGDSKI